MFEGPNTTEVPQEEPKKEEISGVEAFLTVLGYTRVIEHFLETKQEEIRSVVKQAQEGTRNPLLLGDRILNTTSKFMKIVGDYKIETERDRADLQNDTVSNMRSIRATNETIDALGTVRGVREGTLHEVLHGKDEQNSESGEETWEEKRGRISEALKKVKIPEDENLLRK